MRLATIGAACLGLAGTSLLAQSTPPSSSDPAPLAGPKVNDRDPSLPAGMDAPASIVERDASGRVGPLEMRPEEAALARLSLSPQETAATQKILAERAVRLDRLVRENFETLLRLQPILQGGDARAREAAREELRGLFAPFAELGGLARQLHGVLSPENCEKFSAMLREYWRVVVEDEAGPMGEPAERGVRAREILQRRMLESLGQEVRRTYERIASDGADRLERIIKELELSPEQEARVRGVVLDYAQEAKFNPTPEQKTALFKKLTRELTLEQKGRLIALVVQGRN